MKTLIKGINKYPHVRDKMTPHKTNKGGYVWLKEPDEFYNDVTGYLPPTETAVPKKINNEWYWVDEK